VLVMQKSCRPGDCEVHATPSGQERASTCAYLVTSVSVSSNMSCSKFLETKLYPDRQIYSRNKARKLSSQVVIAASFLLLMSNLHKYNKTAFSGKNVTYLTSDKHSGNKHTLNLLPCTGTHSRQDILTLNIPSLARQRCLPWGPPRTPWFFCNFSTVCCGRLLKLCFLGF